VHVGFLDHRRERLLAGPPRLQEGREVAALPEPGDLQIDRASARLPAALTIAVAMGDACRRPLAMRGSGQALHLQGHHAVGHIAHHLPEEIVVGALLNERLQGHSVDRHGPFPWLRLVVRNPSQPRFGP
jgi:hypothetical protein